MRDIVCALCGQKQNVRVLYPASFKKKDISSHTYSARRLPDKIHYKILICLRCELIFSSPIFPLSKIIGFYHNSICKYEDQIPYLLRTYLSLFEKIQPLIPTNPKVLEVGCGNGFFLEALKTRGVKYLNGIEPSKDMVLQASLYLRKRIKIDVFKKHQLSRNFYNLICCFHTLDHMIDPNEFISEAFLLLKKGGRIIVVVHDTKGLSVRLFGERSPIFDIEHIFLFNKDNLKKIFVRHGFIVDEVSDLVNTYPLLYWLKISGLPYGLKIMMEKLFKMFRIDRLPITFTGGNIYLIAKKI